MIIDIFMIWIIVGVILFVLGKELESPIYNIVSLTLYIIIFAQSFWVQVPGIEDYIDNTTSAISLIFIFVNIGWLILMHMDLKRIQGFNK